MAPGKEQSGVTNGRTGRLEPVAHSHRIGMKCFLEDIQTQLKARTYRPAPVRERGIPKRGGKVRYLGIPTVNA